MKLLKILCKEEFDMNPTKPFLLIFAILLFSGMVSAATLYVNITHPSCSDSVTYANAQSPDTPSCTIGDGISLMQGQDTVLVADGLYNKVIYSTNKNYNYTTTVKNAPNNFQVNVTNVYYEYANATAVNCWNNISVSGGRNQWMSNCTTLVLDTESSVMKNYQLVYRWSSKNNWNKSYAYDGVFIDITNKNVYLQLNSSTEKPYDSVFYIQKNESTQAIIRLDNSSNIRFEGLNLIAPYYGFQFRGNSSGIEIVNCTINAGFYGIYIDDTIGAELWNFTIINNTIFSYNDETQWDWGNIKNSSTDGSMENSAVKFEETEGNSTVTQNTIFGFFNGINIGTSTASRYNPNMIVSYNTLYDIMDDAIEVDSWESNHNIFKNTIYDVYVGISLSNGTCLDKCSFYNNTVMATNQILYSSSLKYGEIIKMRNTGQTVNVTNWVFDHNTFYSNRYGVIGSSNQNYIGNTNITNNIFYTGATETDGYLIQFTGYWNAKILYDYNLYYKGVATYMFDGYNNNGDYTSLAFALASGDSDGIVNANSIEANPFLNLTSLAPSSNSIACNMSSTGEYVGAVPCNPPPNELYIVTAPSCSVTTSTIVCTYTASNLVNTTGTYGNGTSYTGNNFYNYSFVLNPTITLTGLTNNTIYNFNITSFCSSDGTCNSTGYTFSATTVEIPMPIAYDVAVDNTSFGLANFIKLYSLIAGILVLIIVFYAFITNDLDENMILFWIMGIVVSAIGLVILLAFLNSM